MNTRNLNKTSQPIGICKVLQFLKEQTSLANLVYKRSKVYNRCRFQGCSQNGYCLLLQGF